MRPRSLLVVATVALVAASSCSCSAAGSADAAGPARRPLRHVLGFLPRPAAALARSGRAMAGKSISCGVRQRMPCVAMSAVGDDRGQQQQQQPQQRAEEEAARPVPACIAEANKKIVSSIKDSLAAVYGERHYARFYALETIARVPYFAYTSVLHLYETLGWRRRADLMKIHFAESWNELHHLLIMEELGGNERWGDRVVAVHLAFFYYWVAIAVYMASPETAYNLNEQVERHAFDTYDKFLRAHEAELRAQPAPRVAKQYYETGDLYMFDEFHTTTPTERRRPRIETLYDVFVNVRNDEREHFLTMEAMQQRVEPDVVSPNSLGRDLEALRRPSSSSSSSSSPAGWSTVKQRQKAEEE